MEKFDLHTHSNQSDGTLPPGEVVAVAKKAGVSLMALTDHDSIQGVAVAVKAGGKLGVRVVPGLEMDTEFPIELHMLGLGIDPGNAALLAFMEQNALRRQARNQAILAQLEKTGIHLPTSSVKSRGTVTRLHVALALVAGGYAQSVAGAFETYLRAGKAGYVHSNRIEPEAAISLIHEAGGIAVLAHPCKLACDVHALVYRLAVAGLDGIEAFYPVATPGQRARDLSLAEQYGLLVSCGSDFHGANRPVVPGSAWENHPALAPIYDRLNSL
ncbi:MAG: PHP domain-containing protein [Candidatus Pelethousia sp.]|nr:PHP domain-containing protein [Candidatus Pelethousia sp.]